MRSFQKNPSKCQESSWNWTHPLSCPYLAKYGGCVGWLLQQRCKNLRQLLRWWLHNHPVYSVYKVGSAGSGWETWMGLWSGVPREEGKHYVISFIKGLNRCTIKLARTSRGGRSFGRGWKPSTYGKETMEWKTLITMQLTPQTVLSTRRKL